MYKDTTNYNDECVVRVHQQFVFLEKQNYFSKSNYCVAHNLISKVL